MNDSAASVDVLRGRRILLGVSGGIAAYKAADLASRLVQIGADVHVVMTQAATSFIGPLTFQTLTGRPVYLDILSTGRLGRVDHVELAHQVDLCLVAPATANVVGRMANGLADDYLTTVLLGTRAPILIAPAMEEAMYEHPAVQENLQRLRDRGVCILEPERGRLASGREGRGRLPSVEVLISAAATALRKRGGLHGKRVLVTAGPTREYLDAIRYVSNPSTGKMGFAVAEEAGRRGAAVHLISGPSQLATPPGVKRTDVETADEMYHAVMAAFTQQPDIVVMAAAVSDYRPVQRVEGKRKKDRGPWRLELERTRDILAELGHRKEETFLVGFAAESGSGKDHARAKLREKRLDLIVYNDVSENGAGFASDTNRVSLLWPNGKEEDLPLLPKAAVASRILDAVESALSIRTESGGHRRD